MLSGSKGKILGIALNPKPFWQDRSELGEVPAIDLVFDLQRAEQMGSSYPKLSRTLVALIMGGLEF